jgi:tetratricopeptide (TPR) repeat protein
MALALNGGHSPLRCDPRSEPLSRVAAGNHGTTMANRFCASCGAKLLAGGNFCVECGEPQPGAQAARRVPTISLQRYAPLFVVLAVLAIGGGAVVFGTLSPKTPQTVPRRDAPQGSTAAGGNLPEGHPPITVPEEAKQAMRDLAAKAAAAPDDMDAWKRLAEVQYRASQFDPTYLAQAQQSYQHVLEREPNNPDAIHALGNIAFDMEQPDQAVEYYQRYLKQKPDDLEVQTDLGTMYLSARKPDEAIKQYEMVLKTNPSFFQAQFNLAIAYRALGDSDKMIAAFEKARALAPDDKTRAQVDHLIARAKNEPAAPPGMPGPGGQAPAAQAPAMGAAAAPPPAAAPAGTFQAEAENVFRQNPILGPKVGRIEWSGAAAAKVYLSGFPMDQMPPEMKSMFEDRMKDRIKEKKAAHQVTATASFELIDEASGKVLDTITE